MNSVIKELDRQVEVLRGRMAAAAEEPFDLGGRTVKIEGWDGTVRVWVNGVPVGDGVASHSNVGRIAKDVTRACGIPYEQVAEDLTYRLRRAAGV